MYLEMMNGLNVSNGSVLWTEPDMNLTQRIQGETEWLNNVEGQG